MGKIKIIFFTLFVLFISVNSVSAVCTAEESNRLNSLAVNVKASYEVITKEEPKEENFNTPDGLTKEEIENYKYYRKYFRIYINNITEDLYVIVTNKSTGEATTYYYSDSDNGTIILDEKVYERIVNYTIDIFSTNKTNCQDAKLYTMYLTTPMYNSLSKSILCQGIEDYYLCQEYLSVAVSYEDYEKKLRDYRNGKVDNNGEEVDKDKNNAGDANFFKDNKALIICVSLGVLLVGGVVTGIIAKKQRSKKL